MLAATSVWKRGAVWNTCNNNNNNKSLLTVGRCGYCGGDTPGLVLSMDAPASADSGAWGVALPHTHTLMRVHTHLNRNAAADRRLSVSDPQTHARRCARVWWLRTRANVYIYAHVRALHVRTQLARLATLSPGTEGFRTIHETRADGIGQRSLAGPAHTHTETPSVSGHVHRQTDRQGRQDTRDGQ
jgi:hypothetical protein